MLITTGKTEVSKNGGGEIMNIEKVKSNKATLRKLKNLLEDGNKKVHGVFYTNTFFSRRYLSRSHILVPDIDIKDDKVELQISTRLEPVGIMELENTLDMLIHYEAGDIPGFTPESDMRSDNVNMDQPHIPEPISIKQSLYSVDIFLIMKEPDITYKEFSIAGTKFTLVKIHQQLDEDFEQTVYLLFGEVEKLYLFSHFYGEELNLKDTKSVLDLIIDQNITGKTVMGVRIESPSGISNTMFPLEGMISSYYSTTGDVIFSSNTGFIRIPRESMNDFRMTCIPQGQTGAYTLQLDNNKDKIEIHME